MSIIHFLNVKDGDCSVIQHSTNHVSVIDVCNAFKVEEEPREMSLAERNIRKSGVLGNFNRKEYPDNPIAYLQDRGIRSVFRFIATHPDMDHLDGIKAFFEEFRPVNFWDTDNAKAIDNFNTARFNYDDWEFYQTLRDNNPDTEPKRLVLYSGAKGAYYNQNADSSSGGDGLHILAPTPGLIQAANEIHDYNDASYVVLYRTHGRRILFSGDAHDETWAHVLQDHLSDVANVDVLIAPHHGRDSGRSYEFLKVLNPTLTLFGNARCEHLAYSAWHNNKLLFITNNQAGTIIMNVDSTALTVYASYEPFAKKFCEDRRWRTRYDQTCQGYSLGQLTKSQ